MVKLKGAKKEVSERSVTPSNHKPCGDIIPRFWYMLADTGVRATQDPPPYVIHLDE
jgi:hypothetical protein